MIKHEHRGSYGNNCEIGFFHIIEWINSSWHLPTHSGEYLISDENGKVTTAYFSTNDDPINRIIFESMFEDVVWDNGDSIPGDELARICYMSSAWYRYNDYGEYDQILVIFKKDPPYWMPLNSLRGPTKHDKDFSPIHILRSKDRSSVSNPVRPEYFVSEISDDFDSHDPRDLSLVDTNTNAVV